MPAPILPGFYPDPSVCRRDGIFYVVNSTFQYFPAIPIHSSSDLRRWSLVGNAYDREEQLDLSAVASNSGLYAPTIRCHEDAFYIVTSDLHTADQGHLIIRSDSPSESWSTPVRTAGAIGIDPDLFWDPDGTCHLSWKGTSTAGLTGILSAPIDPDTGELLSEVRQLWQGTGNQASPEGPHLYYRNGYYYCLLAEGGTERTHSVTIARSRSLDGPWEPHPRNPILTHRGTTSAVQNVGHADLLDTGDDNWIAVYLGVRPRGFTPKFHVNGRETFLADVNWVDDWPIIGEPLAPSDIETAFTDTFSDLDLHPRWISHGGLHRRLVRPAADGLVIEPHPEGNPIPALAVRARDEQWTATVRLTGHAAFQVHMDTSNWAEIIVDDTSVIAQLCTVGILTELARIPLPPDVCGLSIEAAPWPSDRFLNSGPDELVLAIESDRGRQELARFDGRLLSTEVTTGFTGRTIGMRAQGRKTRVTEFVYQPG